jgi:hypothetical protein
MQNLSTVPTLRRNGERTSIARHARSNKDGHGNLTLQGPRGQWSPQSGQMPSLRHAAQTRQHCTMVTTGTTIHIPNTVDRMHVRFYPPWDGIHDKGLDLEAVLPGESHDPNDWDRGPQPSTNKAIDNLGAATNSCMTPSETRR